MKIIVLSTAIHPIDYQNVIRSGYVLNPSHQHYVVHLLKMLAMHHEVIHLSSLPLGTLSGITKSIRKLGKIQFYYPLPTSFPFLRYIRYRSLVKRVLKKQTGKPLLLLDGNSKGILSFAKSLSLPNTHVIVTDHPRHFSGITLREVKRHEKLLQGWDGYITLTPSLNKAFNLYQKPYLLLPGFVEVRQTSSPHKRPYFFFSGALYTRYGIDRIIDAYLQLGRLDIDLVIAGHGPEASFIERLSQTHKTIKFLGLIDHDLVYRYQSNALLNLHPRPRDEALDNDSIPSKLFEYLSSGAPTMSVIHPYFYEHLEQQVEWLEVGDVHEWIQRLKLFLNDDHRLHLEKAQRVKAYMLKTFSYQELDASFSRWLSSINVSKT